MLFTPLTPTDVTPGITGSYQDIDSSLVPAGASGVRVRFHNTTGARATVGLRKNGSTDALQQDISAGSAVHADVGVDGSGIFECFIDSGVTLTLLGYWGDEAVFLDDAVSLGQTTTNNVYEDMDISALTGADTAIAAIGLCHFPGATNSWGVRKNGGTDSLNNTGDRWNPFIIGVDESEIFEAVSGAAANSTFYLIGYVKSGGVFHTNFIEAPITSDATWTDYTLSEPTATYGFFVAESGSFGQSAGVRQKGSADAWFAPLNSRKSYLSAQPDGSGVVEVQRSASSVSIREVGYVEASAADVTVQPGTSALAATGFAPNAVVTANRTASPGTGALALATFAPAIRQEVRAAPGVSALALTGFAPTAALGPLSVHPATADLALMGFPPVVQATADRFVRPGVAALTIDGLPPAVALGPLAVSPGPAAIDLQGHAPAIRLALVVRTGTGALTIATFAPALAFGPAVVSPGASQIAVAGFTPTIARTFDVLLRPGPSEIAMAGDAPVVALGPLTTRPGRSAMTIATHAPDVALGPLTVAPGVASLTVQGHAPEIAFGPATVRPGASAVTIDGHAPDLAFGPLTIAVAAAALMLAGHAPTTIAPVTYRVGVATLTIAGHEAAVGFGPAIIRPGAAALVVVGFAPNLFDTSAPDRRSFDVPARPRTVIVETRGRTFTVSARGRRFTVH